MSPVVDTPVTSCVTLQLMFLLTQPDERDERLQTSAVLVPARAATAEGTASELPTGEEREEGPAA